MAVHDHNSQRLYVDFELTQGVTIEASREQANYLLNVLRLIQGDSIHVFNGKNGEWTTEVQVEGRKKCSLIVKEQLREQPSAGNLVYCFAPLKQARLDYMVQKAVEMGVGYLQPIITNRTQVRKVNLKRFRANIIEAAEQCGILSIPALGEPLALEQLRENLGNDVPLIFCDEGCPDKNELKGLTAFQAKKLALLIGPEGGFDDGERKMIDAWDNITRLGLGPRILRADTAAVAALALIQSQVGDWYL